MSEIHPLKPAPPLNLALLRQILEQPAAPFRERHVIDAVTAILRAEGVPHFADPVGNIVVGVGSKSEYAKLLAQKTGEPVRVFIAHMDHPGFHGLRWQSASELEVAWHGGSPTEHLEGARVWLASSEKLEGYGEMHDAKLATAGRPAIERAVIRGIAPEVRKRHADATSIYGGFGFREFFWQEGELIYSKAADDLVGTFAIVLLAIDHLGKAARRARKKAPPFIGLLTRAEEVGFIGAIGHLELGWLNRRKRPVLGVSLETSRQLPGAEIGKGPVVRLGDRYTVFDAGALRVFTELAAKHLADAHQRRVMDGGTCEASAATVYGFPCVGISVPLGNYHNQSFEGGPDSRGPLGPAPEFVHRGDIQGLLTLCGLLLQPKLPWQAPFAQRRAEFKRALKRYQPLLKRGP